MNSWHVCLCPQVLDEKSELEKLLEEARSGKAAGAEEIENCLKAKIAGMKEKILESETELERAQSGKEAAESAVELIRKEKDEIEKMLAEAQTALQATRGSCECESLRKQLGEISASNSKLTHAIRQAESDAIAAESMKRMELEKVKETSKTFVKKAIDGKKVAEARAAKIEEDLARSAEVTKQLETRIAEIQQQLDQGAGGAVELETTLKETEAKLTKTQDEFERYKQRAHTLLQQKQTSTVDDGREAELTATIKGLQVKMASLQERADSAAETQTNLETLQNTLNFERSAFEKQKQNWAAQEDLLSAECKESRRQLDRVLDAKNSLQLELDKTNSSRREEADAAAEISRAEIHKLSLEVSARDREIDELKERLQETDIELENIRLRLASQINAKPVEKNAPEPSSMQAVGEATRNPQTSFQSQPSPFSPNNVSNKDDELSKDWATDPEVRREWDMPMKGRQGPSKMGFGFGAEFEIAPLQAPSPKVGNVRGSTEGINLTEILSAKDEEAPAPVFAKQQGMAGQDAVLALQQAEARMEEEREGHR